MSHTDTHTTILVNTPQKNLPPALRTLITSPDADAFRFETHAPWQTVLWALIRLFTALLFFMFGLACVVWAGGIVAIFITGAVFVLVALYLFWRGVQKLREWKYGTKQFLLLTRTHLIEVHQKTTSAVPWSAITAVTVEAPQSEAGVYDPFVMIKTTDGVYPIFTGKPVNPFYGSTGPFAVYNILPGAMAFSPQDAYYVDGALAIKNKITEFWKRGATSHTTQP